MCFILLHFTAPLTVEKRVLTDLFIGMESKISKLKGIHCEFRHCITYTENGSEVAVQTFMDSFGRTVYGTLGTRDFSRVRREFSVLAEGRHNFGRRPKPRAATALERSLAPRLCLR